MPPETVLEKVGASQHGMSMLWHHQMPLSQCPEHRGGVHSRDRAESPEELGVESLPHSRHFEPERPRLDSKHQGAARDSLREKRKDEDRIRKG